MKKQPYKKSAVKWLSLNTIIVVFIALSASLFVQITASIQGDGDVWGGIFRSLGIIIPMCAIITIYNIFMFKSGYRHIQLLSDAITQIANGDFAVRIDTKKANSLKPIYDNINIMTEELQNMELMKNDFINTFSHEFKTPISCINGFAELLLSTDISEKERLSYLQIIYNESSRLSKLSENTILMTKLDNQSIIQNKQIYSLDEQLRRCAILISNDCKSKNININIDAQSVAYYGNKEIMQQLWLNLLSNAVKFTPENGDIKILLSQKDCLICVSICDSGIGLTQKQIDSIFQKYYQVEKCGNSGLGLGLSISKKIVYLCKGKISVASEIGKGSTFTVQLQSQIPIKN